eukprot:SAG31_NODE_7737_length_1606_cov_1.228268_1_plen_400_part_10
MSEHVAKTRKLEQNDSVGQLVPYETLRRELCYLEKSRDSLEMQLASALSDAKVAREAKYSLLQRGREQDRENSRVTEQMQSYHRDAIEAQQALEQEREQHSLKRQHAATELQNAHDELQRARDEIRMNRRDMRRAENMQTELLKLQCELRDQQRLRENATMVQSLQFALQSHSAEVEAARKANRSAKEQTRMQLVELEEQTQMKFDVLQAEQTALRSENAETAAQLRDTTAELNRWKDAATMLCDGDPDKLYNVVMNLQLQLRNSKADQQQTERRIVQLQAAQARTESQQQSSNLKIVQIQQDNAALQTQRDSLNDELHSLKSERDSLQKIVEELSMADGEESTQEIISVSLEELQKKCNRMQILEDRIASLQCQLSSEQARHTEQTSAVRQATVAATQK